MKKLFILLLIVATGFSFSFITNEPGIEASDDNITLKSNYDIYYQIFVRSFADSNADGIGDLNGITERLPYLKYLGVTAIWLTPIHITMSYHGYDVYDYKSINPDYGTIQDLENLIAVGNEMGIKIILDMVFNHVVDKHAWWKDSTKKDYFVYNNGQYVDLFPFTRDLNFRNEDVINELKDILEFYHDKGIKGFRMDAVKHFFDKGGKYPNYSSNPVKEGSEALKKLYDHMKAIDKEIYFVSEYFGGDHQVYDDYLIGSTSMFNFELSNLMKSVVHTKNSSNFNEKLPIMYQNFKNVNESFIDAPFLGNHDLDRLANSFPHLHDQKLLAGLLMTLPGNPFIYYGDELGMKGVGSLTPSKVPGYSFINHISQVRIPSPDVYDEPRRLPFLWDIQDPSNTTWFPDMSQTKGVASVSNQVHNKNSIFHYYKALIELRKNNETLMYGNSFIPINTGDNQIIAYKRTYGSQTVIIYHNLSQSPYTITTNSTPLFGSKQMDGYSMYVGRE